MNFQTTSSLCNASSSYECMQETDRAFYGYKNCMCICIFKPYEIPYLADEMKLLRDLSIIIHKGTPS